MLFLDGVYVRKYVTLAGVSITLYFFYDIYVI